MSKRLQVLLEESELEEIRRAAATQDLTVSAWVRTALRQARERQPSRSKDAKLEIIREAARIEFPTADIGQMLDEIEEGFLQGS